MGFDFYLDLISWLIVPLIFLRHLMKKGRQRRD
jgi:hypothetical protein